MYKKLIDRAEAIMKQVGMHFTKRESDSDGPQFKLLFDVTSINPSGQPRKKQKVKVNENAQNSVG